MSRLYLFVMVCLLVLTAACVSETNKVRGFAFEGGQQDSSDIHRASKEYESKQTASLRATFTLLCKALAESDIETFKALTCSVERDVCDWDQVKKNLDLNSQSIRQIVDGAQLVNAVVNNNRAEAAVLWGNGQMRVLSFIFEDDMWRLGGDPMLAAIMEKIEAQEEADTPAAPKKP
jgi:hypothetical protein